MKDKLAQEQKEEIIAIMSALRERTSGDTDECIDIYGPEIGLLLKAFKIQPDKLMQTFIDSEQSHLRLRETLFLEAQRSKTIVNNARTIVTFTQGVIGMLGKKD